MFCPRTLRGSDRNEGSDFWEMDYCRYGQIISRRSPREENINVMVFRLLDENRRMVKSPNRLREITAGAKKAPFQDEMRRYAKPDVAAIL